MPVPSAVDLLKRVDPHRPSPEGFISRKYVSLHLYRNCSHGCSYCVSQSPAKSNLKLEQIVDEIGAYEYLRRILNLFGKIGKVHFQFSGPGECAEYEGFATILRGVLNAGHRAHIQTHGLTSKVFEDALACYGREFVSENVTFGLSFHYGDYLDDPTDRRLKAYLYRHYPRIVELGAQIRIIVPATPQVLACPRFEGHLDYLKELAEAKPIKSFTCEIIELQGAYRGKRYPAAFTDKERGRLFELTMRYGGRGQQKEDIGKLGGPLFLKGLPCYQSAHAITVTPAGVLRYCLTDPPDNVGNLMEDTPRIAFTDGPVPCPHNKCLCKSAGIRLCLNPLGISLTEYFDEIDRSIRSHGSDYVSMFRLSAGRYEELELRDAKPRWCIGGGHGDATWLTANFQKQTNGHATFEGGTLRLLMPGRGNFKTIPCFTSEEEICSADDSHKGNRLWQSAPQELLLPPGAYLVRFRASGDGRLQFGAQLYCDGKWQNFVVHSYDFRKKISENQEPVLIQGRAPVPFRPVFGLNHPGDVIIHCLELFRAHERMVK